MKGIINRRASKKVTSFFRDNRVMNARSEARKKIDKNNKKEGGTDNVK